MKNRILLIFAIVILLTNFISAYEITITPETNTPISMFSGETKTINLTLCHDFNQRQRLDLFYNITNNTFNLDGLYISFPENPVYTDNCTNVQLFILTHPLYNPDSWILEIYAETFYKGEKYTSRSSSKHNTIIPFICEPNWECSGWSECINNEIMTRNCKDTHNCAYSYNKPIERTGCETNFTLEGISLGEPSEKVFFSRITGVAIRGITDFATSGTGIAIFGGLIIIVLGGIVFFNFRRK